MMQHHLRGAYSTMVAITGEKSELMKFLEYVSIHIISLLGCSTKCPARAAIPLL